MPIFSTPPLGTTRAKFQTHLNYIRRLEDLLKQSSLSVTPPYGEFKIQPREVEKFRRLDDLTRKSISKDIELAREDSAFAVIAAPWFPVKCYYSIYYLESILSHLIDGSSPGFGKGGHAAIRKKMRNLISSGRLSFNIPELNRIYSLTEIARMAPISQGANARGNFWQQQECSNSLAKKLMEYKLHDAKLGRKWDLHTKKHQKEKGEFIASESLICIDFFFWYRIKANYRDLDYIDFENGITENEVAEYVESFYGAFKYYRNQLVGQINRLSQS